MGPIDSLLDSKYGSQRPVEETDPRTLITPNAERKAKRNLRDRERRANLIREKRREEADKRVARQTIEQKERHRRREAARKAKWSPEKRKEEAEKAAELRKHQTAEQKAERNRKDRERRRNEAEEQQEDRRRRDVEKNRRWRAHIQRFAKEFTALGSSELKDLGFDDRSGAVNRLALSEEDDLDYVGLEDDMSMEVMMRILDEFDHGWSEYSEV